MTRQKLDELVQLLTDRLSEVIPADVQLRADGGDIVVTTPGGLDVLALASDIEHRIHQGFGPRIALIDGVANMLGQLQDTITVAQKRPWPSDVNSVDLAAFPDARVQLRDDDLQLWFEGYAEKVITPILHIRLPLELIKSLIDDDGYR